MPLPRQLRLRVLEALEERVKQFRTREAIHPLRTPRDPIPLEEVVLQAIPDDHRGFDEASLRSRTLLTLKWDAVTWTAWVITLPSGVKIYCDSDAEETRLLASGGRNAGDDSDRLFLMQLAETAGEAFGIGMDPEAPTAVRSSLERAFLVEFFVNLFEGTSAEASIGRALERQAVRASGPGDELLAAAGRDFKVEVERWLDLVLP